MDNRGGARTGAGRKKIYTENRTYVRIRLTDSAIETLDRIAKNTGQSRSDIVDNLLNKKSSD